MKKKDLIESWLNSEITEDEAILLLERMKHDDKFTKELVEAGEVHACLYTIFHEDTSFDALKLHELSKSPDEIEDQIMQMISDGPPKEKSRKKRITVVDLPQNVTAKTKSFEKSKNYWPLVGGIAAILAIILTISIFSEPEVKEELTKGAEGSLENERISLIKDNKKKEKSKTKSERIISDKNNNPLQKPDKKLVQKREIPKKETIDKLDLPQEPVIVKTEVLGEFSELPEYSSLIRNGQEIEINNRTKIRSGDELATSFESKAKVKLTDGSLISLQESTGISFFAQKIIIKKGKAYFEIKKQKQGQFKVMSGEALTTVVGTKFSVTYLNNLSLVKVDSGIVKVKSLEEEVTLNKGQEAVARDGQKPLKRDYSEQYGVLAAEWTSDQIGPQVSYLEFDVSDYINSVGYHDFYFKKKEDHSKGMLQIFKVDLFENGKLLSTDEHNGVTSNHTTELRNRNVWLHGGYGSGMYRFYLKAFSGKSKYTIRVRCRSFKGSCPGEIWLLSTVPKSDTLVPGLIPQGKNLAYRKKTITEKPEQTQSHGSDMLVDNKVTPQSSWWGAGSKWIQVDLGKVQDFNSVFVVNFWEQNCYHQYFIEVSSDGSKWEKVIDMTNNTLPAHESGEYHRFTTVQARYVRMTVNKVKFSQGGISVVELKVFKH